MESTDDNDVIIYAFLDENKTALSTNDEKCPQQEDFLTLFKVKVAEIQELIQVMPTEHKKAAWNYWNEVQRYFKACFGEIAGASEEGRLVTKISEKPGKPCQVRNSNHCTELKSQVDNQTISSYVIELESGDIPETLNSLEVVKDKKILKDQKETHSSLDSKEVNQCKKTGNQKDWEAEIIKASDTIKDNMEEDADDVDISDEINSEVADSKDSLDGLLSVLPQLTPVIKSRLEDKNTPSKDKVIHFKVEKVDGSVQNLTLSASAPDEDSDQKLLILQNENGMNRLHLIQDKVNSELSEDSVESEKTKEKLYSKKTEGEIHSQNTEVKVQSKKLQEKKIKVGRKIIVKDKKKRGGVKGRPKRVAFSELCIPVTTDDGREVFACELCGVQMALYCNLEVHLRTHTGQRPFSCNICGKSFTTKGNMEEHKLIHDRDRPEFRCEECGKTFKQFKCLKIHSRTHTGERPYRCHMCEKAFTQPGVLQSHLLTHTNEKNHLCVTCGKVFRLKPHLELHKKRHENKRDFKCTECNFSTITKNDLLRHMVKHTGEKRFTCSVCSKRFTRAHYLNEHMNTHTGKTPYKCSQCDAAFSLATKLYCHKRKHRRELAQKLVRETQSEGVIIQSIPQDNQSVSHIEIQNVEQTGSPKHINNTITLLHDPENQSDFVESVRQNPILIQQTENGLKIIDQSDSGIPTGTALLEKQRNVSVSHVNEGLWSGEEQCVELVIGQDISEEDLKNLITSRVISLNP